MASQAPSVSSVSYSQVSWSPLETQISRANKEELMSLIGVLEDDRSLITGGVITSIYYRIKMLHEQGAEKEEVIPIACALLVWGSTIPGIMDDPSLDSLVKDDLDNSITQLRIGSMLDMVPLVL